jgi:zinc transporter ZupT
MWQTAAMGAVVGVTVYLGLPAARLRARAGTQSFLTSLALGTLLFAAWDVLSRGLSIIETALHNAMTSGHWQLFWSPAAMLALGLTIGLVGLAGLVSTRSAAPSDTSLRPTYSMRMRPSQLAAIIAAGLGLYNFAEGLAISQAAAGPAAAAVSLSGGLASYNIAVGLAIAAPMAFADGRPSWSFLGGTGVIGGGPVLLGTLAGPILRPQQTMVFFLGLGTGALFFVIGELFAVSRRFRRPIRSAWGIVIGFLAAYGVHLALTIAGV